MEELLPGWVTVEQAQELTSYTGDHLRRLARGGQVVARKVGQTWIFNRESLLAHHATARPGRKERKQHS